MKAAVEVAKSAGVKRGSAESHADVHPLVPLASADGRAGADQPFSFPFATGSGEDEEDVRRLEGYVAT